MNEKKEMLSEIGRLSDRLSDYTKLNNALKNYSQTIEELLNEYRKVKIQNDLEIVQLRAENESLKEILKDYIKNEKAK
jgi:HD superfamily phosphohydrolase